MCDYIKPLSKKASNNSILHVGTNHTLRSLSGTVLDKMLLLKSFIEKMLPQAKVYINNQQ